MTLKELKAEMDLLRNPVKAKILQGFFKTGKGQYGEGDIFLGIVVPELRKLSKKHENLSLNELQELLDSKIHEHRLISLFILINHYKKSGKKKEIADFYLKNTRNINNWDLVDLSAPNILGDYLLDKDRRLVYRLANSENLWEKRISMLATFTFIRHNEFEEALRVSEILLKDKHDLMHKAVGWMLREIGKRDMGIEEGFLKKYHKTMPRTMLRYAIERFPEAKRRAYLGK